MTSLQLLSAGCFFEILLCDCDRSAQSMDLIFNCKKSCLFKAGVGFNEDVSNLHLNGGDVGWVDKLKYHGIYILKDRFCKIDTSWVIRKFYAI